LDFKHQPAPSWKDIDPVSRLYFPMGSTVTLIKYFLKSKGLTKLDEA